MWCIYYVHETGRGETQVFKPEGKEQACPLCRFFPSEATLRSEMEERQAKKGITLGSWAGRPLRAGVSGQPLGPHRPARTAPGTKQPRGCLGAGGVTAGSSTPRGCTGAHTEPLRGGFLTCKRGWRVRQHLWGAKGEAAPPQSLRLVGGVFLAGHPSPWWFSPALVFQEPASGFLDFSFVHFPYVTDFCSLQYFPFLLLSLVLIDSFF